MSRRLKLDVNGRAIMSSLMNNIKILMAAGSFAFSSIVVAQGMTPAKEDLECRYLSIIEQGFLANHVKYSSRDLELANRLIEQYLKRLDPSKIYLVQNDVDAIKKSMINVFEKTKNRDCSFLDEAQKLILARVSDRSAFAKQFLGKDFKFDPTTEFGFDPDKRAWPKNGD